MALPFWMVEDLQEIVREEYGVVLSFQQASTIASGLVSYFDLLAKIHYRSKAEARGTPSHAGGGSGALSKASKTPDTD